MAPHEGMATYDVAALLLVLAAGVGLINDRWFHAPRNIALLIGAMAAASLVLLLDGVRLEGPMAEYWGARMQRANLSGVLLDGVLALLLLLVSAMAGRVAAADSLRKIQTGTGQEA